jgi:hypothetical protein
LEALTENWSNFSKIEYFSSKQILFQDKNNIDHWKNNTSFNLISFEVYLVFSSSFDSWFGDFKRILRQNPLKYLKIGINQSQRTTDPKLIEEVCKIIESKVELRLFSLEVGMMPIEPGCKIFPYLSKLKKLSSLNLSLKGQGYFRFYEFLRFLEDIEDFSFLSELKILIDISNLQNAYYPRFWKMVQSSSRLSRIETFNLQLIGVNNTNFDLIDKIWQYFSGDLKMKFNTLLYI